MMEESTFCKRPSSLARGNRCGGWTLLDKEKTNTRRSNWFPVEEAMPGPQEGSKEKGGGDILQKKKLENSNVSPPPHPHTHHPPSPCSVQKKNPSAAMVVFIKFSSIKSSGRIY